MCVNPKKETFNPLDVHNTHREHILMDNRKKGRYNQKLYAKMKRKKRKLNSKSCIRGEIYIVFPFS